MNRAYGIATLVGLLGLYAANPTVLTPQAKNESIKFGQKGEITYEISRRLYSDEEHDRTARERPQQSWGHFHIGQNGQFILGAA